MSTRFSGLGRLRAGWGMKSRLAVLLAMGAVGLDGAALWFAADILLFSQELALALFSTMHASLH